MITVMLVDDHDLVRTGVKRLLEDNGGFRVVAEATSGEEALQLLRQANPRIVLMDINMPGIGGLEATHKMLQQKADLKIIVSMHTDELFPQRVLKAGAMGYLTKGSRIGEIVHAIHEVLANIILRRKLLSGWPCHRLMKREPRLSTTSPPGNYR